MRINKAYKFRLYPNAAQRVFFAKTFGSARFIYNQMLSDKISHYEKHKESLATTPAQYKGEFPWLKEVDSLALANAQMNLNRAYRTFFTKQNKFPKFKKRRGKQSYTTNNQKGSIAIRGSRVKLPKIGEVKLTMDRPIPESANIKSATISKVPSGKYFISILVEMEVNIEYKPIEDESQVLGLDFSMPHFYISSDDEVGDYPKFYRKYEDKLKREQRKLSKMQRGKQ